MEGTGIAINAILVCEKVTPLNEALPYFFAPVWAAFKYDQPDNSSSSFSCALLRLPFPTAGVVQPPGLSRDNQAASRNMLNACSPPAALSGCMFHDLLDLPRHQTIYKDAKLSLGAC
jgi:hypothetical protein